MSHQGRVKTLLLFEQDKDMKIMIVSLKCGGVGLNLTMASRVICVDLWWNDSVEEQGMMLRDLNSFFYHSNRFLAFCRVFRIGQESETFITRFVVKDTVDEQLQDMQNSKSKAIGEAIDNPTMLSKLSLHELMRLFGPVEIGDDRKPFILVDDDGEFNDNLPPDS